MGQGFSINFGWEGADRTDGGKLNYNNVGLACFPYCMVLKSDTAVPPRQGLQSIQSKLLYTPGQTCGGSYRCEFQIFKNGVDSLVNDVYYALSIYPINYVYDIRNGLVMQWYHNSYPVAALWQVPDPSGLFMNLQLVIQCNPSSPSAPFTVQRTIKIAQLMSYQWTDIAAKINWKNDNTGYVDLYYNGVLQDKGGGHTYSGPTISAQYNPAQPKYPTFRGGIYMFGWSNAPAVANRIANYDVLKVGGVDMVIDSFLFPVTPPPPLNLPPIANAGTNTFVTLPANGSLNGSASTDPDGTIASSLWTHVSAGTATITTPATLTSTVTSLSVGEHKFQLRVTDNKGLKDSSIVTMTVFASPPVNIPPTANAGANQTVVLPATTAVLTGTATDPDGTIVSRVWAAQSATGTYSISSPNTGTTNITNLQQGRYVFIFTVTDNNGATNSSTVEITVIPDTSLPLKLKVKN